MSGSRAVWKEVLAVYAVKITTDPDAAQEVATMDDSKKQLLKDIFWQMNEISSRTESKTEEVITETDDGHGNIVETTTTATRTYLYITVSHKTAVEMADRFSFNADQRQQHDDRDPGGARGRRAVGPRERAGRHAQMHRKQQQRGQLAERRVRKTGVEGHAGAMER